MTKAELLIEIITKLPMAPEQTLHGVLATLESEADDLDLANFRFTPEQLVLIEQSFDDYKHGRTMTFDEAFASITAERHSSPNA